MAGTVIDWVVTDAQRARFATLSGDHNPIHTDPVAARRLQGGRLLVHGAHLLLGVIEQATTAGLLDGTPTSIDVRFLHGVEPDAPLETTLHAADGAVRATVTTDALPAVEITIVPGPLPPSTDVLHGCTSLSTPDDLHLDDLDGLRGEFALRADPADVTALVPHAVELLGPTRTAEIAQLSRVVGMRVPGLRSMSARYRISFEPPPAESSDLVRYHVDRVDHRMRRISVDVVGPSTRTTIVAFSPIGPIDQLPIVEGAVTDPGEFSSRRVLVVGGSRGLGAATVVLLTARGADVRFTYRVGVDDAAAVAAATGAAAFPLDTLDDVRAIEGVCSDGWQPTHLAWFATPPYGDGTKAGYSHRHHDELLAVQVDGFVAVLAHLPDSLRSVLWPSSALLDRSSTRSEELADVKRRGEAACDELRARHPAVTFATPRLPLMLTDQTTSLLPTEYADTALTLLTVLRGQPD